MTAEVLSRLPWDRLTAIIAARMGLHFPPDRLADLQRGLDSAAPELGARNATALVDMLLAAPLSRQQLHVLASHLTIGETYFFRERLVFQALTEQIIPELIVRRSSSRGLRLWSAACCTGEEPYSLSILLQQCIPDIAGWHATVLGTDINERFLQKAVAGTYGEWSFRDVPEGFREHYFTRTGDERLSVLPQIRQRVRFAPLNLAEDSFPSLATDTQAMDIIFCRNVLMYFTREQAARVVEKLRRSLRADGWLVLSSTEANHALSRTAGFTPVNIAGVTLYRKSEARVAVVPVEFAPSIAPVEQGAMASAADTADSLYRRGAYSEAAETLVASLAPDAVPESPQFSLLARACANQGQLKEALSWCDQWIAAEPLESGARYLRAMILEETGNTDEARRSLQQAIYLEPEFVLAHFALGNLARNARQLREARRHFDNTLALLHKLPGDAPLPESDGLTAARLKEVVESLFVLENAP